MGNSMMSFQNRTFWINDFYLEPIIFFASKLLTDKINNQVIESSEIEWFRTYNDNLKNLFMGASDGALDFDFDILNENNYRIDVIKELLNSTYSILNSIDVDLRVEQFEKVDNYKFGHYANWSSSINTKVLAEKTLEILNFIGSESNE